jgi:hypothetical protein
MHSKCKAVFLHSVAVENSISVRSFSKVWSVSLNTSGGDELYCVQQVADGQLSKAPARCSSLYESGVMVED